MGHINPRKIALDILVNVEKNRAFSNISISNRLMNARASHLDRRFISNLVYGVLENKLFLDYIISNFSKTKIKKIDINILNILRLGLYQILFLDKIPESAAVNESVKLAKKINYRLSGFVNGILRNFIRNKDKIKLPDRDKYPIEYLSIKYSHPIWLVEKWIKDYGIEFTEKLLKANNSLPKLSIRVNTLRISKKELIDRLRKENVNCTEGLYAPESIIIERLDDNNIEDLDSFRRGYFQVQDESSMLVGHVLNPKKHDFVLDVCSAPGGKSTHIAQLMNNRGKILSRDIHEHKLKLIKSNAERLGISIIDVEKFDALQLDKRLIDKVDKVLIDAPCSGFGIIRRKPEIRYFKEYKDVKELAKLQFKILNTSSKYVKPGGVLVYSTCTIQNEENQNVIRKFLKNNNNFIMENANNFLPDNVRTGNKYIQLYPHTNNVDGFFISRFKRIR